MRACVMRGQKLIVDTFPDPEPGPGEVLVRTLACGICGSDLHMLKHRPKMVELAKETGQASGMDVMGDIVMGHEFCAEIVDYAAGSSKSHPVGTRVCSMPVTLTAAGPRPVGYSPDRPGGYGELMSLAEVLLLPVPNGLDTAHAALTEPMAVGLHAVEMARVEPRDVPLVVGCGPVGLSVIAALRLKGVEPILAADFSPRRRALAETLGAHVAIDPNEVSPYDSWRQAAGEDAGADAGMAGLFGAPLYRPGIVFECVGVPGVIQQILKGVERGTRIVVVGVCMEDDGIQPIFGINKELNLQFVLGYTPEEFARTLRCIAEGEMDVAPLVTSRVGVDAVPDAFETLARPDEQAKILVEPWR